MADLSKTIRVWAWEETPEHLKALSTHGGDEDWVAFVPPHYADHWIGWLESGTPFGVCEVYKYECSNGVVYIGAHA